MDDSITVLTAGNNITTGVTSAIASVPVMSSGEYPRFVRLSATANCYAKLGPVTGGVTATPSAAGTGYIPTEVITLTGGTATTQAQVTVATTKLISAAVNAAGTGYAPADTIVPAGGTFTGSPLITVTHTKAITATVVAGGTGGTPGAVTITGTTGTGTKFQATGTINGGGVLTGALVVTVAGDYTVNPTNIAVEPITGGALTGCTVLLTMGCLTVTAAGGAYTANGAALTQTSASGTGTGATFNTVVYGVNTATVSLAGDYSILGANPMAQGSTTGAGTGATMTMTYDHAGLVAAAGDLLIQPAESVVMQLPHGITKVAAIQVTGAGVLNICALENM